MDLWNLAVVRLLSIFNPLEKDCCNDDSSLTRMQRMRMASTVTSCLSHGALKVPVGHRQLWRTQKIDTHTHTQSHTDMTNEKNTRFHTHTHTKDKGRWSMYLFWLNKFVGASTFVYLSVCFTFGISQSGKPLVVGGRAWECRLKKWCAIKFLI